MAVPELVRERLGERPVRARIPLSGEDELVVTTDRTLVYRAEGLLSGDSIEEIPHDAEAVSISEGRRKSTLRFDHGIDGESEFSVPSDRLDEALAPLLGGVLSARGVVDPDESVEAVHRLGELTVIIAEGRVVKHVGSAVWDGEFEEYAFEDVTGLDIEEGDVSSQIIVEVTGRPQRIKAPSEEARQIRERIERALLAYHGVESYRAFQRQVETETGFPDEHDREEGQSVDETARDATAETGASSGSNESRSGSNHTEPGGEETASTVAESTGADFEFDEVEVEDEEETVAEELAALREAVEHQNELLETQQRALKALIEELQD